MKTITVTRYRRPKLFGRLLKSLAANDLPHWHMYTHIEPSPAAGEFVAARDEILHDQRFRRSTGSVSGYA